MYHIKFSKFGGIFMKNITIKEIYRNSDEYFSKDIKVAGWIKI